VNERKQGEGGSCVIGDFHLTLTRQSVKRSNDGAIRMIREGMPHDLKLICTKLQPFMQVKKTP
jgi:hypothetical protein